MNHHKSYYGFAVLVLIAILWIVAMAFPRNVDTYEPGISSAERIEEDEPGWDCTTMGNRICGTP